MAVSALDIAIDSQIVEYENSQLRHLVEVSEVGNLVIKYVHPRWANAYDGSLPLVVSNTPALTWGTGTYVTPLAFPMSSVLYGRVGVVAGYDPSGWRIFDATSAIARRNYLAWAARQPDFDDLVFTVHSADANHQMRNRFRERFRIDCVLFRPDQSAQGHTESAKDIWMLVTDWVGDNRNRATIDVGPASRRFSAPRFSVLIDEEFDLGRGLPVRSVPGLLERPTALMPKNRGVSVDEARGGSDLPQSIAQAYADSSYLHIFLEP